MRVVFYKLPSKPEDILVATSPQLFEESDVAILLDKIDAATPTRFRIRCDEGFITATQLENESEPEFEVEDHNNFVCILPRDCTENAILAGKAIRRALIEHEEYNDRLDFTE